MPYRGFNKRKRFSVLGRRVRRRIRPRNAFLARRGKLLRYGRYARGFGRAALAYEAGSAIYRAARKHFSPRMIGDVPGTGTAKKCAVVDTNPLLKDTRTLYTEELTTIPQGTDIDERERRIANLRGFKICAEIANKSTTPLYVNVAVISTKQGTESSGIETTDFFRAAAGASRARDFSTALNSNEMHCLPINTDRYIVLRHKRYRLIEEGGTTFTSNSGNSFLNLDWYVKINRQIRWDSSVGQPESGAVYLVYWFDLFQSPTLSTPVVSGVSTTWRAVAIFRDPDN